jgi:hypothetical protein
LWSIDKITEGDSQINKQCSVHPIKPTAESSKRLNYNALHPQGSPTKLPEITQKYDNNNTIKSTLLCPDDQWEEEATKVLTRQSTRLVKHTNCVSLPLAGIL